MVMASSGASRMHQARVLAASLPESPAVLGGDFNTWAPGEQTIPLLRERFSQPETLDDRSTMNIKRFPDRRLDYLLFDLPEGQTARYRRLDETFGSDHHPLLGWVQLTPRQ
jgi:endonuclease/exonuclease/phosphatase (EEP) superfamily protein YafD